MATQEKTWNVANRLHSQKDSDNPEVNHIIAGADEIYDDAKELKQSDHNAQTDDRLSEVETDLNASGEGIKDRVHTLEEQVAFEGEFEVENTPQGIVAGSGKVTSANAVRGAIDVRTGYFECITASGTAKKEVSAPGFVLTRGGSIKIKMTNSNTVDNATLDINVTGEHALYYAGERASAANTWDAGETVDVYYDGTNFYANNVAGGSGSGDGAFDVSVKYPTSGVEGGNTYTLEGALAVLNTNLSPNKKKGGMSIKFIQNSDNKYVQARCMAQNFTTDVTQWQGVDDEPTAGSRNLVESGGVAKIQEVMYKIPVPANFTPNKRIYSENNNSTPPLNIIEETDGNYIVSEFIEVEEGSYVWYSGFEESHKPGASGVTAPAQVVCYNANKTPNTIRNDDTTSGYGEQTFTINSVVKYIKAPFQINTGKPCKITKKVNGVETDFWEPTSESFTNYVNSNRVLFDSNDPEETLTKKIDEINETIDSVEEDLNDLNESIEPIIPLEDAIYTKEIKIPANYEENKSIGVETASGPVTFNDDDPGYIINSKIPLEDGVTYKIYTGFSETSKFTRCAVLYNSNGNFNDVRNYYNTNDPSYGAQVTGSSTRSYVEATFYIGNGHGEVKITKQVDGDEVLVWEPIPEVTTYESYIKENKVIDPETEILLSDKLARLQPTEDTNYNEDKLYIGGLANIMPKIVGNDSASDFHVCMDSSIFVPYRGVTMKFKLPDGIKAGVKCGNSGAAASTSAVSGYVVNDYNNIENGDTQTLAQGDALYRVYFQKTDNTAITVSEVEQYIETGEISITYNNYGSSIISDNSETDKLVKALLYKAHSNVDGNNAIKDNYVPNIPVFAHISDIHGDALRLERCMQYCDYLGVTACLVSGDQVNFNRTSGWKFVDDIAAKHTTPMLLCLGNHDGMPGADTVLADKYAQLAYSITRNQITTPQGLDNPTYYYKDFAGLEIRLIVLDQWYSYGSVYYGQNQIDWFIATLADTPNNYSVIVMAHSPEVKPTRITGRDKFYQPERLGGESFVHFDSNRSPVKDIVDAFISRGTLSASYTSSVTNYDGVLNVNADFTSVDSSIKFIAQVSGHEHQDLIGITNGSTQNQVMLNITTGASIYGLGITNAAWADHGDLPRGGKGSVQDAFNLYGIDVANGVIRIVRVGSNVATSIGESNYFVVRDYMTLPYNT